MKEAVREGLELVGLKGLPHYFVPPPHGVTSCRGLPAGTALYWHQGLDSLHEWQHQAKKERQGCGAQIPRQVGIFVLLSLRSLTPSLPLPFYP